MKNNLVRLKIETIQLSDETRICQLYDSFYRWRYFLLKPLSFQICLKNQERLIKRKFSLTRMDMLVYIVNIYYFDRFAALPKANQPKTSWKEKDAQFAQ